MVCPSALTAPWAARKNQPFLLSVKAAVCGDWDVIYSPRVGQDPRRARRLLGIAAAEALGTYGNDVARQALAEMSKARSDDPEIVAACVKALGE